MKDSANFPKLDMREVYHEHDLYTLDQLAEKLFGIKNFSKYADKIKELINNGTVSSEVSKD